MKNELIGQYLKEQAICSSREPVEDLGAHVARLSDLYGQLLSLETERLRAIQGRRRNIPLAPHLVERLKNYRPLEAKNAAGLKLRKFEEIANGEFFTGLPCIWNFGPTYHTQTALGEDLTILTMSQNYDAAYDNPYLEEQLQSYKRTYMLALDEQGYPVAFQEINFIYRLDEYYRRKEEYYRKSGSKPNLNEPKERRVDAFTDIYTSLRGKGLAIPLQIVALDFLQREANTLGQPITRKIENANELLHDPDEEEVKRWHRIWGHDGWLSHDPRYIPNMNYREGQDHRYNTVTIVAWMQFVPNKIDVPMDGVADIMLTRTEITKGKGDLIRVQAILPKGDDQTYQKNQRIYLQQLLDKWEKDGVMTLVVKEYDF